MPEGRLAQLGAVAAEDGEPPAGLGDDLDGAAVRARLAVDGVGEAGRVRGPDDDARTQPGPGEVGGVLVGDEAAFVDGDDAIGGAGRLFGIAGRVQDGAAVGRVRPQQSVQPTVLAGRETGGGLVEDEGVRVAQQGGGETESAVHAEERVPSGSSRRAPMPTRSSRASARAAGTPAAAQSMRSWPLVVRAGCPGTLPSRTPTSRAGWAMRWSGRPRK